MPTVFDMLRSRLLARAGLLPVEKPCFTLQELQRSEWSEQFEKLMRNRLLIGALRYGRLHAKGKPKYDRIAGAQKRLRQYAETGNRECLVDAANTALLEFEEGQHMFAFKE